MGNVDFNQMTTKRQKRSDNPGKFYFFWFEVFFAMGKGNAKVLQVIFYEVLSNDV